MLHIQSFLILALLGVGLKDPSTLDLGIHWDEIRPEYVPIAIFFLRSFDLTLSTLRMLLIVRGKAVYAWVIGFIEALSFLLGITGVISNLQNPLNIGAYAAGFATGNIIGMSIESKVAPGHSLLRIISPRRGYLITEELRKLGRGVTDISAKGVEGMVSMLLCYVPRREVNKTKDQIISVDSEVFIQVENVRELRGGWRA
jgi:uncharacterized protein YebE (UPF0316 family)